MPNWKLDIPNQRHLTFGPLSMPTIDVTAFPVDIRRRHYNMNDDCVGAISSTLPLYLNQAKVLSLDSSKSFLLIPDEVSFE